MIRFTHNILGFENSHRSRCSARLEVIGDISNDGGLNRERQSLTCHFSLEVFTIICYTFLMAFHPLVEDSSLPILLIM